MWREITAEITLTTTTPNISAELQAASQPIARLSLIFTQCHDLRLRTENSCEHDSYPLSLSLLFLFLPAVQFHFFLDLLNITFPPASIFCLPSSRRSSVCRKTTLRFRSHARWPKPNLPHPPQMCVCFSHMSVSLYICMCVCVLKLVLQNASGWTHTIEHEARSVCASGVFSWVQLNLSWLWEASGLFNKLWASVWRLSAGLTPRWRNYTCCKDEEEKKEKKRLQWNRKLEHFF